MDLYSFSSKPQFALLLYSKSQDFLTTNPPLNTNVICESSLTGLYNQRETDSDDESSITLTSSDNSYSDYDDGDEFERFAAYKG